MLVFGHVGVTTAVVGLFERIAFKNGKGTCNIDYRVVMAGSMLPDIIDKPLGRLLFRHVAHSGRLFAHSLMFSTILIGLGFLAFLKWKKNSILLLGICSVIHQIADWMFQYPKTFFWPVLGEMYSAIPVFQGLSSGKSVSVNRELKYIIGLKNYFLRPYIYIPEIIGLIIVGCIFYNLFVHKKLGSFLKNGSL